MNPTEIYRSYDSTGSQEKTAQNLGISRWSVRRALAEREQLPSPDENGEIHIQSTSDRVRSLEDLLARFGVDLSAYEVVSYRVNQWESAAVIDGQWSTQPLHQVRATLKPLRAAVDGAHIKAEVLAWLSERGAKRAPLARRDSAPSWTEPVLAEFSAPDLHFGKLAWGEEVDGVDYDSAIAESTFLGVLDRLVERSKGFQVDRVLFPVGNDLLHSDGSDNATFAGTQVDVDSRHSKIFRRTWRAMVEAVERLLLVAPVDVLVVPGNHDFDTAFKVGEVLEAWFRSNPEVTVDNSPASRKYYRYGGVLLGFTHGKDEKDADLPQIMAHERPQWWSETVHREWHLGHLHLKRETKYVAGDTFGGVRVRRIPSLSATDEWHYRKGYVGSARAAELYLYGRDGYVGSFEERAR